MPNPIFIKAPNVTPHEHNHSQVTLSNDEKLAFINLCADFAQALDRMLEKTPGASTQQCFINRKFIAQSVNKIAEFSLADTVTNNPRLVARFVEDVIQPALGCLRAFIDQYWYSNDLNHFLANAVNLFAVNNAGFWAIYEKHPLSEKELVELFGDFCKSLMIKLKLHGVSVDSSNPVQTSFFTSTTAIQEKLFAVIKESVANFHAGLKQQHPHVSSLTHS